MSIQSMIGLGLLLALGLAGVVYSAREAEPLGLLGAAGFVNLVLAAVGIGERRSLSQAGAGRSAIESVTARAMGLIWLWGAAALVLVYNLVLSWREWTHFSAAFAAAGLISLGFSALLAKDAEKGKEDATLLRLGRYFAIAQLVGMIATLIGLAVDPDKEILYAVDSDWAGNGIFLFGALALALVSAYALIDRKKNSP
jgi:inner membrane protein involved in colicin E2 resistance